MRIIAFVGSPVEDNEKDVSYTYTEYTTCLSTKEVACVFLPPVF